MDEFGEGRPYLYGGRAALIVQASDVAATWLEQLHQGGSALLPWSFEPVDALCSNRRVKPNDCPPAYAPSPVPGMVIPFAGLRLPKPLPKETKVLIEYQDPRGDRSYHQVSLTCTGQLGGMIYFGGIDAGKFSIFRADCIHRVISLESVTHQSAHLTSASE